MCVTASRPAWMFFRGPSAKMPSIAVPFFPIKPPSETSMLVSPARPENLDLRVSSKIPSSPLLCLIANPGPMLLSLSLPANPPRMPRLSSKMPSSVAFGSVWNVAPPAMFEASRLPTWPPRVCAPSAKNPSPSSVLRPPRPREASADQDIAEAPKLLSTPLPYASTCSETTLFGPNFFSGASKMPSCVAPSLPTSPPSLHPSEER
mmetsp:Transcript_14565/g.61401  ORF Transcript_14565/g.61401 Transcript_14565/m.61401 type:complete len:205 (+) Transcript_14565:3095-3709(+)